MSDVKVVAPAGAESISVGSKVFRVVEGFITTTADEAKHLLAHAGCLTEAAFEAAKSAAEKDLAKVEGLVETVIKRRGKKTADAATQLAQGAAALADAEKA